MLGEEAYNSKNLVHLGLGMNEKTEGIAAKYQLLTLYTPLHTQLPTNKAHYALLSTSYFTLAYE